MPTILVIDDEKNYYELFLERYLTHLGYTSFGVRSGEQGLEFVKNIQPDLILLDWCLKKSISGEETLRIFKSLPAMKNIPVIVISGIRENAEDELRARRAGAAQFITKSELSDTVADLQVFKRRLQALILDKRPKTPAPISNSAKNRAHAGRTNGRVLVIDDDPEIRDMIAFVLRDKGYTILTADKGEVGLAKARQDYPDLVILDLSLPDMDGLEVCTQLKASPKTRPIPVLILTARTSTQAQLLAVEYNADHYFTKPIPDLEEFHNWIAAFLRRRSHLDGGSVLHVGSHLIIDTKAHTLTFKGRVIEKMPATLFRLLCEFARRPGEVLDRDYLVRRVWARRVREHNVDTNVSRLKNYLGDNADDWFVSVTGKGYRLLPVADRGEDGPTS